MEQVNDVHLREESYKVRWWIELARTNSTEPSFTWEINSHSASHPKIAKLECYDLIKKYLGVRLECHGNRNIYCSDALYLVQWKGFVMKPKNCQLLYWGHGKNSHGWWEWQDSRLCILFDILPFRPSGLCQLVQSACRSWRLSLPTFFWSERLDDWRVTWG
jgi:hypothetical protein